MKNSLVIGGSGFLGSHLIQKLIKKNHKVSNYDNKKSQIRHEGVKFINGNILNEKKLDQSIKNKDYVFLFAGLSDLDEALVKPIKTVKLNILAICLVAQYCVKHRIKRLIFASSIYAGSEEGGFYSCSKRAAEDFLVEFSKKYKLKFTILRYGSLYGPRSDNKNGLYRILINAIKKNKLEYYGFPHNRRKYIHVHTASILTYQSLNKRFENKFLNLVGKEDINIFNLFKLVEKILDKKIKRKFQRKKILGHYVFKPTKYKVNSGKNIYLKNDKNFYSKLVEYIGFLKGSN
jgi:UDP-glucose 4-epimerase